MKEKFIKSTIILVIGGFITKILSMLIRIIITRQIGSEGIGLYMLIMPTFQLFITIGSLSLATAVSKVVAEDTRSNKKLVLGVVPIAMIFNVIIIIIIVLFSPIIAKYLLQNKDLYYPILAMAFTLPFITLSSIARGYFFGKQQMIPHVTSNIFEQIVRIIIILVMTPILLENGIIYAITGLILFNIVSEFSSILILFLFLPKKVNIRMQDLRFNYNNTKDIASVSIPTTLGRLISSFGMFLEPIIITFAFLKLGYNNDFITKEYGIISGYVLPMVMMPAFLSGAISSALLPVISKYYQIKKIFLAKKKIKQAIIFSLAIGIPFTIMLVLAPEFFLKTIFNTTDGSNLLVIAAPIFLISYIQGPLVSSLQAMNKSKLVMISSVIGIIIKTIFLLIFSLLDFGVLSILIASLFQVIYVTVHQLIAVKKLV